MGAKTVYPSSCYDSQSNFTGNNYKRLEDLVGEMNSWEFSDSSWQTKKVSVIVSLYNQPEQLKLMMLALSKQSYALDNIEIIIADDGSKTGKDSSFEYIAENKFPFGSIKYVWQPDDGFRLAKVRNEALKVASHNIIISLDADMIPSPDYVAEVMKRHYVAEKLGVKIMTVQDRFFVEPKDISPDIISSGMRDIRLSYSNKFNSPVDWRKERRYSTSDNLKCIPFSIAHPDYFIGSTFSGGNSSFSKMDAFEIGLFDELFKSWGGEDTLFGLKMFNHFSRKYPNKFFMVPIDVPAYHIEHQFNGRSDSSTLNKIYDEFLSFNNSPIKPSPLVSVYITSYNYRPFLKRAVDSVLAQEGFDLKRLEVVIADDGSDDGSIALIKQLQKDYAISGLDIRLAGDFLHVGIAENTNRAIRACRGEYILELDGDDMLHKDALSKLYGFIKSHPDASIVFGDCYDKFPDGRKGPHWSCEEYTESWHKKNPSGDNYNPDVCLKPIIESMNIHPPRMFSRSHFYQTEGVNISLGRAVDYDFCLKLVYVGQPYHLKDILYTYDRHNYSDTHFSALQRVNDLFIKSLAKEDGPKKYFYILQEDGGINTKHFIDGNNPMIKLGIYSTLRNSFRSLDGSPELRRETDAVKMFYGMCGKNFPMINFI